MGPLLILDGNPLERRFIAASANGRYRPVLQAGDAEAAGNALLSLKQRPALIVAALDPVGQDALILLRWMHNARSTIPVVVIADRSAGRLESKARSLGARIFVHDPDDAREVEAAMEEAVRELGQQKIST